MIDELIVVLKDRYTAVELVELLELSIDDAVEYLYDAIEINEAKFAEEWRLLGYDDES